MLKTLSGETHGFEVSKDSHINYNGKPILLFRTEFND
jgi:hypothetical protein